MQLPLITNAPRELVLGGAVFRARALTLGDLGEVLAWLEDRLPPEEDPETGQARPLRFSSDAARLALASTEGLAVVLHLALLSCHPALTRLEARILAAEMTAEDETRLMAIAFRRRPMSAADGEGAPAKDLTEINWGMVWEGLSQHRAWVYPEVGRLTLDQYDSHAAKGELAGPDELNPRDVQRMWEDAVKGPDAAASPDPEPTPEVLP